MPHTVRMLAESLTRIPEFTHVPPAELRALAGRSHVLCLPAERWLVREGKTMQAYFYLLKGRVATVAPELKITARKLGQLNHFYPGCAGARTLSAVQILRIEASQHDFLCAHHPASFHVQALPSEQWLSKFLGSHMMRRLPSQDWQKLLTAFSPRQVSRGNPIVRRGDAAGECFVIEAGHAVVHDESRTLCHLGPGDFFGEDALVLGGVRNAHVTALEAARVQAINHRLFADVVLERLIQYVSRCERGSVLELGVDVTPSTARELAAGLDVRDRYYVAGGSRRQRALCALLLIQRGIQAFPLDKPV